MLAVADDERRGVCGALDAAVVRVRGDFYCRNERFPSIYIVCFVLRMGGAISFLIYGDLVIYEEGKKEA